ncbi:MAG: 50S ribosomal protein L23 [Alphaproteobacteria bacterium]|nr:50S ribosomal protein L23 [Alphaproteobacteria bacterium]
MMAETKYDIVRRPMITEKSTRGSEWNQVTFEVADWATKAQIKSAVEALFEVKVKSVNTLRLKGKIKRFRNRAGRRRDVKKAIVTLEEGQMLDVTTGI